MAAIEPSDSAMAVEYEAFTADATLDRNDSPKVCTNVGATGTVVLTLPQNAKGGEVFKFTRVAAQALRVDPGAAGAIYAAGIGSYAKQADGKYVQLGAVGDQLELVADGNGDWIATNEVGTITVEV